MTAAVQNIASVREPVTIPPMTDPLGLHWKQPPREEITIDDLHALMSQRAFDRLAEYSTSVPSGVYVGKMWKRHDGAFDRAFLAQGGKPTWLLCWYGPSARGQEFCSVHTREILIV
jgi:hypothetical protein